MEKIFQKFVDMLVTAGIISGDKKEAANEAASKLETPEMLATLVKEEVANQVKNYAAPSMKVADVARLIEGATDDEKTAIAKALNVQPAYDDKDLKTKLADLSGKVATLIVGEAGGGQEGNGASGIEGKVGVKEPSFQAKEALRLYGVALENGKITQSTFDSVTKTLSGN